MSGVHEDYEFGNKLGEGNYAIVNRAVDNESGAEVAIKTIAKAKLKQSSQGAKILVNEIACMKSLDHPNILKLERVYEDDNEVYLILELVGGGDLFTKIIETDKFNERYCAVIARKMLVALAYMHERNIIHRDLKLENIMMTSLEEESDIKIADFGFAAEMTPENLSIYCGSPGYVAPEILQKVSYDAKADVFSTGIILYIILSGNSPFFGRNVEETIAKNREARIVFDETHWRDVSSEARDFIQMITERRSIARPTAADALKHVWIQTNNRQYFESFEAIRRPSFSKRRTTGSMMPTSPKSPLKQKTSTLPSIRESAKVGSPRGSFRLQPIRTRPAPIANECLVAPISIKYEGSISPRPCLTPSGHSSGFSPPVLTSPTSVDDSGRRRRKVTWKHIKPHP